MSRRSVEREVRSGRAEGAGERPRVPWPVRACLPLALAAAVFAAFWPALGAEFVNFDDDWNLLFNHRFRGLTAEHLEWMFTTAYMGPYQPLSWLSLAFDHALWGLSGPEYAEAPGYHLTNVALHALAALAVYLAARRLLAIAVPQAAAQRPLALSLSSAFAALVFALHPLRVESVAWVTERRDVLSGLFVALAAWAWLGWAPRGAPVAFRLRSGAASAALAAGAVGLFAASVDLSGGALALRGPGAAGLALSALALWGSAAVVLGAARSAAASSRRWYALSLGLFLLALLSKGLAMTLPAVLLVLDAWPLRRFASPRAGRVRALGLLALEKAPFLALAAIFALLAMWGQSEQVGALVSWREHTATERAVQALYGLSFYSLKTLLPLGLQPIYELPETIRLTEPRFLAGALGAVALAAGAFLLRRRAPAVTAALAAFAVMIAPVLGLSQAGPQIVADRYSYLAAMPFALLAGGGALTLSRRGRAPAAAALAVGLSIAAALGVLCWRQARVWRSSEALWEYTFALDPANATAHLSLGVLREEEARETSDAVLRRQLLDEASRLLQAGFDLREDPRFLSNLAKVHEQLAALEPAQAEKHMARAVDLSRRALKLSLERGTFIAEYRLNLGVHLAMQGRVDLALEHLRWYAGVRPDHTVGLRNFGLALLLSGRPGEAAEVLERSLRLEPRNPGAWGNLGRAYEQLGQRQRAVDAYRRSLELAPGYSLARERLRALGG